MAPREPMATTLSGFVEILEAAEHHVFVGGWLRISEVLLAAGPPLLRLRADDGWSASWPLRRLTARTDLPATDSLPAGLGFRLLVPCPIPDGPVTADLSLGGEVAVLGPGPQIPAPFRPRGALEPPIRAGLHGWMVDLPGRMPMLLVEDCFRVPLRLDQARPDVLLDTGEGDRPLGFRIPLETLAAAVRASDPAATLLDGAARALTLVAGRVEMAEQVLKLARSVDGRLERAGPAEISGWATELDAGEDPVEVDILLDGTRWATVPADTPRPDLSQNGVGDWLRGGVFRTVMPWLHPGEGGVPRLVVRAAHGRRELPPGPEPGSLEPLRPHRGRLLQALPEDRPTRVCVVIPADAPDAALNRCVEAVLRYTGAPARLVLAAPKARTGSLAVWTTRPGILLHGVVGRPSRLDLLIAGIALAEGEDVVLLDPGTVVGPGWLDGLRIAALAGPRTGTVTPLCSDAAAFSAPEPDAENLPPGWLTEADMARLARQASLGAFPPLPLGGGFCLYIRHACLAAIGAPDPEDHAGVETALAAFCLRAARAGFENLLDDRTLVGRAGSGAVPPDMDRLASRYPEVALAGQRLRSSAAMLAIRWRLRRALEDVHACGGTPRQRLLFVISTEAGGTPQTNRDLMEALSDRYEGWVLRCDGPTLEVARYDGGVVETWRLEQPVDPVTHRSGAYDERVADILLRHGIELVHIRHLAWHSTGLPALCRRLGIPVVLSFHDFYAVCPSVKLLDAEGQYCGGRCTTGEADCAPELWERAELPLLRGRFVHRWRAMMEEATTACDAFVTTSASAAAILQENLPSLAARGIRVIPHGRDFPCFEPPAGPPGEAEPLRILCPGHLSNAKGAALIDAIAELDSSGALEFHILGTPGAQLAAPRPNVVQHGAYARAEFQDRVRRIRPHLGAVLSIWPETYCHTLTECWAAGLPVLTTALGAQGERVAETGAGWVAETADPQALLALLLCLRGNPAAWQERSAAVEAWQCGAGGHRDTRSMAASYDLLYRELLEARRAFRAPAPSPMPRLVLAIRRRNGAAPRLAPAERNRSDRPLIFRQIEPSYPFGEVSAGRADAVFIPPGAIATVEAPELLARCRSAGLPLVIEVENADLPAWTGGPAAAALRAAVEEGAARVVAIDDTARTALAASGIAALPGGVDLPGELWLRPSNIPVAPRGEGEALRLLLLGSQPAARAMLHSVLEDLEVLGIAEAVTAEGELGPQAAALPPEEEVAVLRALARGCVLALLPDSPASGEADRHVLAAAALGLPLLRHAGAGETPGEARNGALALPGDPAAWLRAIAELVVDTPSRAAMAQQARRHAQSAIRPAGVAGITESLLMG